ncbi:KRR1 family protein [Striga hermonthica]|uniref:KRR1 family protein n=1 Tax=Striga hermonthica TaxID=68872 RepID=A0A9N7NA96_STRHE|nr:KRR1 family protein [Striga hermonthica]
MGRLKLFDDDGDFPDDDVSKIEINHEFAKRYEHNKKREELQRYEELKKQGRVDSSESDSDDSSEEELMRPSKKTDSKFLDALIKVKKQDPVLRDKDAKLFDSDSDSDDDEGFEIASEENEEKKKKKKDKPMYLKNVVAQHLIEEGADFDSDDEDEDQDQKRLKSYSEEQEELRKEFLKAVEEEENDDGEDFLTLKKSGAKEEEDEDDGDDEIKGKLDEYFGEDEKLDEDSMFLKNYLRNRMWIDEGKSKPSVDDDDDIEYSEDEEEIERQEDYERSYNFRYEENAGDRILGHSRKIEGSVRKKDNARKSQRERKEERMAQAEFERKEELKRLKNLKKKEIKGKLEKIREVAGIGKEEGVFLDEDDLEEEFDPAAYDQKMKEAFGDDYYDAEDADPGFGSENDEDAEIEKPDFDKEDELLGLPKGWDEAGGSREGFLSAREEFLKKKGDMISENGDAEEDVGPSDGKRKRKRKMSDVEKAVREQLMEEYYKLDYEDTIGDLKTRFKYRPVKARRFGLNPVEILTTDDKELNQYVSLKKIAPYREKEWKVPRIKTIQLKQKKMSEVKDRAENDGKEIVSKGEKGASKGDEGGLSKSSKRRHRQAKMKLSHRRRLAYGKI